MGKKCRYEKMNGKIVSHYVFVDDEKNGEVVDANASD